MHAMHTKLIQTVYQMPFGRKTQSFRYLIIFLKRCSVIVQTFLAENFELYGRKGRKIEIKKNKGEEEIEEERKQKRRKETEIEKTRETEEEGKGTRCC
jgi:hypothetical protein